MSPATIDLAIRAAADVSKAEAGLDSLGDTARRMGDQIEDASDHAERASRNLDGIGDAADNVATKGSILAGAMGDIGGGLEAAGLGGFGAALEALSTPLMFAAGLGDLLAVSMESLSLATIKETASNVANRASTIASSAATKTYTAAQWLLNAAMEANPIGLIVIALVALVAGLVLAYKKSETVRKIVNAVGKDGAKAIGWVVDKVSDLVGWVKDKVPAGFNTMKRIAVAAFNAIPIVFLITHFGTVVDFATHKIPAAFNTMKRLAGKAWDAITKPVRDLIGFVGDLIDKIKGIHWPEPPGWVKSVGSAIGKILRPIDTTPTTTTVAAVAAPVAAGTTVYNITVQGAVDPDGTARTIKKLLDERDARIGKR